MKINKNLKLYLNNKGLCPKNAFTHDYWSKNVE